MLRALPRRGLLAGLLLLYASTSSALAQPGAEASPRVEHGVFGGPLLKISSINGHPTLFVGGRGGWIIDNRFVVGGGGYGLLTNVDADLIACDCGAPIYLNVGYGGLELEYVVRPHRRLHASVQGLVGGGKVSYRHDDGDAEPHEHPVEIHDTDAFFVVEPGLNLVLGVTRFLHLSGGLSYRHTAGVGLTGTSNGGLSGLSGVLSFRLGLF